MSAWEQIGSNSENASDLTKCLIVFFEEVMGIGTFVVKGGGESIVVSGKNGTLEILVVISGGVTSSARGCLGKPGIRNIPPVLTTRNPAPAEATISLTFSFQPVGTPLRLLSSLSED